MARLLRHLILLVVTGLVGAALAASPASSAPTWQPVTNLFADLSATGGSSQAPAVEVDPQGNATALWSRYDGTQWVVQASARPAGGTWSAPVDLGAGRSVYKPQLAVDPAGNLTAVWRRSDGTGSVVQAASQPFGGTWTAPVELSVDAGVDTMPRPEYPQVAVDGAGVATAIWSRYDGSKYTVQAATRAPGGTWTTPVDVSVPGQSARNPQLAVDPGGNATTVWLADGPEGLVQSAARPAGGTWSAPVALSAPGLRVSNPQVAVDPSGAATAVWSRFNGTAYAIQSATRPPGGTWSAPVDLSAPGEDTFDTPQVAVGPQGSTLAVWQRHDGKSWVVTAATRAAGAGWTKSVDVSESGRDAWDPQIAVDPAGNATAVWAVSVGEYGGQRRIQAARRPAGDVWSAPVDLSPGGGNAWSPQVALDPAGNATTAWSRHDGTNWVVQARGLDAAGPVVTALTSRTTAGGRKRAYSVTAHDVWSEVASARWTFADGSTATGTSVTHADAAAGTGARAAAGGRPVRVTLTDRVGNATVCTYTETYTCRTTTLVAPVLTKVRLTHHTIRAVGSESDARKKVKATLALSAPAKVTLTFRRQGTRQTFRIADRREAGTHAFPIRARLAKHKVLLPGRWTITVTATNKVGTSVKKKLRLRVR